MAKTRKVKCYCLRGGAGNDESGKQPLLYDAKVCTRARHLDTKKDTKRTV